MKKVIYTIHNPDTGEFQAPGCTKADSLQDASWWTSPSMAAMGLIQLHQDQPGEWDGFMVDRHEVEAQRLL